MLKNDFLLLMLLLHPFNDLFSRTFRVNRYQKGKTSLDLNEAKDDGVLGCSGISWTICKQSAPHSRRITTPTPHHSMFTGRMLFVTSNQQCQCTEGRLSEVKTTQLTRQDGGVSVLVFVARQIGTDKLLSTTLRCAQQPLSHTQTSDTTLYCAFTFYRATARCYASAVLAMALCLSVRPSQVGVLLKRLNAGSHKQHHTIARGL